MSPAATWRRTSKRAARPTASACTLLPTTISQRLDSDNDEIQSILSNGGYLYYPQPLANTGLTDTGFNAAMSRGAAAGPASQANDAQKVIMAVEGYAQNNALYALPQKAWPYYAGYPSAPIVTPYGWNGGAAWLAPSQWTPNWPNAAMASSTCGRMSAPAIPTCATYGATPGPSRRRWRRRAARSRRPSAGCHYHQVLGAYAGGPPNAPTACLQTATGYFACALWYAHRKGLDAVAGGNFYNGIATLADVPTLLNGNPTAPSSVAMQVNALRFLANAAIAVSGYWEGTGPSSEPIPSLHLLGRRQLPVGVQPHPGDDHQLPRDVPGGGCALRRQLPL